MIAENLRLVLLIVSGGIISLLVFLAAFFKGAFDHTNQQANVIFDEVDLRLYRPWESAEQLEERKTHFGSLLPPQPSEWGNSQ